MDQDKQTRIDELKKARQERQLTVDEQKELSNLEGTQQPSGETKTEPNQSEVNQNKG